MKIVWACFALVCSFALRPATALAQTDAGKIAAARQIGFEGIKDYEAGRYTEASDKLERAYALVKAPTLGLWSARALDKTGRLVLAAERYLETTRLPLPDINRENHARAQADAAKERSELLPRLASLKIDVEGAPLAEVELGMDGVIIESALIGVARPVDPGRHRVVAVWRGQEQAQELELAEGEQETVVLSFSGGSEGAAITPQTDAAPLPRAPLAESPAPEPMPLPYVNPDRGSSNMLAYVALGVGGVGLLTGAVTGVMAMGKKGDLDDNPACRDGRCEPSAHDDVDTLDTLRLVSTLGFVVGAVGTGAGITLLLVGNNEPEGRASARTVLRLQPGSVSLSGRF